MKPTMMLNDCVSVRIIGSRMHSMNTMTIIHQLVHEVPNTVRRCQCHVYDLLLRSPLASPRAWIRTGVATAQRRHVHPSRTSSPMLYVKESRCWHPGHSHPHDARRGA